MRATKSIERAAAVGILGGGQLAQMLVESSARLGLGKVTILEASADCPAAAAGGRVVTSPAELFAAARTVLFENEFVDCDGLAREGRGASFVPGLEVIRKLQDKLSQKCVLHELGIASAPFERAGEKDERHWLEWLLKERFPSGFALKWARQGYDGKGVCILKPDEPGAIARAAAFCARARERGVEVFAEERVSFRRELAIVACRSSAEFVAYPLVESSQENGICLWVSGPLAPASAELSREAVELARRLGEGTGIVGAYALEFFETWEGQLLVNEIAPRVHNTGHYTQDAADTSQFENHLRAALGLPLGSTRTAPAFAMVNLLGPAGLELELDPQWKPEAGEGLFVHWYGKKAVRPGRKLGHVNARADVDDPTAVRELLKRLDAWHSRWQGSLLSMKRKT